MHTDNTITTRLATMLGFGVQRPLAPGFRGWFTDFCLLGARLFAGVWMAGAGLDKLPTPDWMIDQVTQVGFPAPHFFAICAELSEFAGGVLLTFGLLSRPAAFFLAFTMGVAAFGFHRVNPIVDYHITQGFFWLYIAFLAVGPGRFSLDHLLSRVFTTRIADKTTQRRPIPYLIVAGLLASPVIGYGLFREFTMNWTPPPEQASISLEGVDTISIAGSFNDWDTSATPLTANTGVWSADIQLPAGLTELKFVANNTWDMSMGDADQGGTAVPVDGAGELDADNIRAFITEPGLYRVSLNTADFTYTIEQATGAPNPSIDALIGTWRVDLRPTLESPPSYVEMVIESIDENNELTGTFYNGSPIRFARVTNTFGVVRFAFTTEDGSGPYHTSGEIINGQLTGVTHALGRGFVTPWRGERVE
jgi:putative oxidoreductase